MADVKTWSDTVIEETMPVVIDSGPELRLTVRDSTLELLAGIEMIEFVNTVPQDLMDYFK